MTGRTGKLNIHSALISYLLVGIVLPVCLFGTGLTLIYNRTLKEHAYEAACQAAETSAVQMDSLISGISYTASYIISNDEVLEKIRYIRADPTSAESMWGREFLIKYMRSLGNVALYSYNPDISIIMPNGVVVGSDYIRYMEPEETKSLFSLSAFEGKFSVWHDPLESAPGSDLVSYWLIQDHHETAALLRILIPETPLWDLLANHPLLQHRLEIHCRGERICFKEFDGSTDQAKSIEYTQFLRNWNMTLKVIIPSEVVEGNLANQLLLFLVFFMLLLLLLFIMILHISSRISHPIRHVVTQIRRLQQGDTSPSPVQESYQEIQLLSATLNELALRIDGLIQEAAREARQKEQNYYETLMAQINPHFLYNTLNSIKWLAIINGNSAVAEMLVKLGNNLRYSFDQKSADITVEKELVFLEDYFALLQMRFGNGITFSREVPQELLYERIPRFCIQPFLENAVFHGFDGTTEGQILLTAAREEETLVFRLRDNGRGMTPEAARACLEGQPSSGLGIRNVQQRIRLLFGPQFGLEIQSRPGAGCTVIIRLPMQ